MLGLLFLFDIRTRRLGILFVLPPLVQDAIEWSHHWLGFLTVLPWLFVFWMLWLLFRHRSSFGPSENRFYLTPVFHNGSRFWTVLIVVLLSTAHIARVLVLRPADEGVRALLGKRMVNRRGAWTYQPASSQIQGLPDHAFDIYFSPFGYCKSKMNGAEIEGRLLAETHRHNVHLDCLPSKTRLYAEFEIEGDTLVIHNHKNDPPFRLQFVKKNWGPGWYSDFLPGFLTK